MQGNDNVTLNEARETINHLVQGVDPYTGEVLQQVDFLQNPRMIRCFAVMSDVLTKIIERKPSSKPRGSTKKRTFCITKTQAQAIEFQQGDIGVKGILSAVNRVIETEEVSQLSVVSFYKVLKELKILEKSGEPGSSRTVTTDSSANYGIKSVKSTFQGQEYDRIMYTDKAKDYFRQQLPIWFPVD